LPQLWVALAADTEDNHPAYVPGWHNAGSNYDVKPCILKWEWTRYWSDLSECFKSKFPITWLVRVDDGPMQGSMFDLYRKEMVELKSNGDEIGIHIHTFAWNPELSKWVQTKDPTLETRIVRRSIATFKRKTGFAPLSVRMGWYTMSNEIMRTLDANGLLVDSSAIPGTYSSGKFGERDNIYDWVKAPNVPYHPNYDDYQTPGNMRILEIPISTQGAKKPSIFAKLVNRLSGIEGLVRLLPLARRLNLTPNPFFQISPYWSLSANINIIKEYSKKAYTNGIAVLAGSFHACDILDPKTGKKNIIFERYLSRIIEEISSLKGIDVTFTTLSDIARNYDADETI
jgi:hypothetical protein